MPSSLAVSFAVFAASLVAADPSGDAAAACAALNLTQQLELMRGFGSIAGYSRNSGCAGVCGRNTFRWDNGPQVRVPSWLWHFFPKGHQCTTSIPGVWCDHCHVLALPTFTHAGVWRRHYPWHVDAVAELAVYGRVVRSRPRTALGHGDGIGVQRQG